MSNRIMRHGQPPRGQERISSTRVEKRINRSNRMVSTASAIDRSDVSLPSWSLRVHGADVPGRWIIRDGRFGPPEE